MELTLLLDRQGGPPACNVYRLPYYPPPPPGSKGPPPPPVMPPPVTRASAAEAAQVGCWCERMALPGAVCEHRSRAARSPQNHHSCIRL